MPSERPVTGPGSRKKRSSRAARLRPVIPVDGPVQGDFDDFPDVPDPQHRLSSASDMPETAAGDVAAAVDRGRLERANRLHYEMAQQGIADPSANLPRKRRDTGLTRISRRRPRKRTSPTDNAADHVAPKERYLGPGIIGLHFFGFALGYGLIAFGLGLQITFLVVFGLFLCCAGSIRFLVEMILKPAQMWSGCSLFAAGTIMSYFSGVALSISGNDEKLMLQLYHQGIGNPSAFLDAVLAIFLFGTCLYMLSWIERPLWRPVMERMETDTPANPLKLQTVVILVTGVGVLQVLLIASGQWSLQGYNPDGVGNDGALPIHLAVVAGIVPGCVGLVGWLLGRVTMAGWAHWLVPPLLMTILIELMWAISQSRRTFAYTLVTILFFYILARGKPPKLTVMILAGAIALPMIMQMSNLFHNMRKARGVIGEGQNIAVYFGWAVEHIFAASEDENDGHKANLVHRLFLIEYPANLMEELDQAELTGGTAIIADVVLTIPRFIMPNKMDYIRARGDPETQINRGFRLNYEDAPSSIVTIGIGELGWLGMPYMAFVMFLLSSIYAFLVRMMPGPSSTIFGIGMVLTSLLIVEGSFAAYLNNLRMIAAVTIVLAGIDFMMRKGRRPLKPSPARRNKVRR